MLVFFVALGVICWFFVLCYEAKEIAELKGHHGMTYFWWAFWCSPLFGLLIVTALPDRSQPVRTEYIPEPVKTPHTPSKSSGDELPDL